MPGLDPPEEVTKYIKRRGSACDKNGWAAYSLPWKYRVGQGKVETVEVVNGKRMEGRYKQDIMVIHANQTYR